MSDPPAGRDAETDLSSALAGELGSIARQREVLAGAEALILGDGPRYTPAQLWARGEVPEQLARQLWLAMGFPHVPDDEAALTERDLNALRRAKELLAMGTFDPESLVHQTRVMSQALSTIAVAHVETLAPGGSGGGFLAGLEGGSGGDPLPILDELLSYLYRRHLLAALERMAFVEPERETLPTMVVGFADLTDFTATAARATEAELTLLVDDFASVAADVVASAGGRVVKLIGDEVMFSVDDPRRAAELALELVEAAQRPGIPPVHVGLALGPALSHHGDLFGSTVNVASRLSDVARPGTVLVNEALAESLDDDSVLLRRIHLRPLKGVGQVHAFVLRRREGTD
jgi:adenylate cyclase